MLLQTIKEKLQHKDKHEIIKQIGYNSYKKGLLVLTKFIEYNNISTWLQSKHYDMVHTSGTFFTHLCDSLEIDKSVCQEYINKNTKYNLEIERFLNSYVFVNTNFKRASQTIISLSAMESTRRIKLCIEELLFKSIDDILAIVSIKIKNHFIGTNGILPLWGKIDNYVFHFEGNKYLFSNVGEYLGDGDRISESKATLQIKNKGIPL